MADTISLLSPEDVRGIIKEELSNFNPIVLPDQDRFINKNECRLVLGGVCESTVDNLRRRGILKSYKVGSVVRFKRNEVLEAIERLNK